MNVLHGVVVCVVCVCGCVYMYICIAILKVAPREARRVVGPPAFRCPLPLPPPPPRPRRLVPENLFFFFTRRSTLITLTSSLLY